jgi:hypothetical protein
MEGQLKMIKEKSKNRLNKLESRIPNTQGHRTEIQITQEALELLEPYYAALMEHTEPLVSGILSLSAADAWVKVLGDQYVLTTYEGFCGANEGVIGVNVAKRAIEQLKSVYGINPT